MKDLTNSLKNPQDSSDSIERNHCVFSTRYDFDRGITVSAALGRVEKPLLHPKGFVGAIELQRLYT